MHESVRYHYTREDYLEAVRLIYFLEAELAERPESDILEKPSPVSPSGQEEKEVETSY